MRLLALPALLTLPLLLGCPPVDPVDEAVTYTGTLENGIDGEPIEGVEVCFVNLPDLDCVMTDAEGAYTISLPANTEVSVEVDHADFVPIFSTFVTRSTNSTISAQMFPPETFGDYDLTKGTLLVRVYDAGGAHEDGLAGVSMSLDPEQGEGPLYTDGLGVDEQATATTESGNAIWFELDEGAYAVLFSAESQCAGTYHWQTADGEVEATVQEGFITYLYVDCTPE